MAKGIIKTTKQASTLYTLEDLEAICKFPHLIGHIAGYTKLTELHSEWIRYIFIKDGEKGRALQCHRGSYKSTSLAVGVVWRWLFFPETTVIFWRKDFSSAVAACAEVASIMKLPVIRELFKFAHGEYPDFRKEQIGSGVLDFTFKKKPSMSPSFRGLSSGSNCVGLHTDLVIADDISNLQSRVSKAERIKDINMYREMTNNVCNRDGFYRITGTPWCIPGSLGVEDIQPTPKIYYMEDTRLISPSELAEIKANTSPQLFAMNYLMKHISSDTQVFCNPVEGEWQTDKIETPRAHVDFAYTEHGGDHTALTIAARRSTDNKIQCLGWLFKGNGIAQIPRIKELMKLYSARRIYCEQNGDKGFGEAKLKEAGLSCMSYHESTNKQTKITTYGLESWANTVWCNVMESPEYMNQLLDWEDRAGSQSDDAPDSYASLMRSSFSRLNSHTVRWEW